MTTNDLRIFISYAREDGRELAIRLRDDLTSSGYSVWLDVSEIAGGASWSQEIEEAIEGCDIALALLSHASYNSPYCRAEQMRAIRKGKRLIPVNVTGAIGAIALDMGYPWQITKAFALIGRTLGAIGHIAEEIKSPMAPQIDAAIKQALVYEPVRG